MENQPSLPDLPEMEQTVSEEGPLPEGSLLLGMAPDGLPVLLDLHNPTPGPLLVAGDSGSGKTAYLQYLASCLDASSEPGDIQFGVLTNYPEEWSEVDRLPSSMGIWPAYHRSTDVFLSQLINWAEVLPDNRVMVLLFVDDLDAMTQLNPKTKHDLRWLFRYGPERRVWPIVTMSAARMDQNALWMDYFRTYVFAHMDHPAVLEPFVGRDHVCSAELVPGRQFAMQLPEGWMTLNIPA